MNHALQAQFAAMSDEVRATTLPEACKHSVSWCIDQLPAIYAKFHQTSESRYGDEIVRLVQGVLQALTKSEKVCPEARKLADSITDRLGHMHEQLGLPGLNLKSRATSPPRSRKVG